MIIVQPNGYKRLIRKANTKFHNFDERIEFGLCEKTEILVGETWEAIPEATKIEYKTVHLSNHNKVDAQGLLIFPDEQGNMAEGIGFYYWIILMTAGQLGITQPTDMVFVKSAERIEQFLTDNNLWD